MSVSPSDASSDQPDHPDDHRAARRRLWAVQRGGDALARRDDRRAGQVGAEHPAAVERQGGIRLASIKTSSDSRTSRRSTPARAARPARRSRAAARRRPRRCRTGSRRTGRRANRFTPMAVPRKTAPLVTGPASATRKCSLDRGTNEGPTRFPSGQRWTSSWSQSSQGPSPHGPARARPGPRATGPASRRRRAAARSSPLAASVTAADQQPEHHEDDQDDVDPDRRPEPSA